MNSITQPATQGVHHVGLTVPNLVQTTSFFVDVLGYTQVGELADYPARFLSDGATMITLWQAKSGPRAVAFDRHDVVGLHHLALTVADAAALTDLHEQLLADGRAQIEFAPEPLGDGPMQHMICAVPGGIRVEFIAPGE